QEHCRCHRRVRVGAPASDPDDLGGDDCRCRAAGRGRRPGFGQPRGNRRGGDLRCRLLDIVVVVRGALVLHAAGAVHALARCTGTQDRQARCGNAGGWRACLMAALPRIESEGFVLRPWQAADLDSLVLHANDEAVSRTVSDRFPFPYTKQDAEEFLHEPAKPPAIVLAIEIDGVAVGGIDVRPGVAEFRVGAEIGYWLARRYWGSGIMSRAVACWCRYLFAEHGFE